MSASQEQDPSQQTESQQTESQQTESQQTCHQCRHHSKAQKPSVVTHALETIMDTLVEFADEDAIVYHCRAAKGPHAGKEVGPVPVQARDCGSFEAGRVRPDESRAKLDALMARAQNRTRRSDEEDGR